MGQEDDIRLDIKSDITEGEKARKKLAEVEQNVKQLRSSFEQGNVTLARFNQEMKNLEGQATRAQRTLDKVEPGKNFSFSTNKLQVFAQGLDDLQYVGEQGLRPIANNLVQINPLLGVAAIGVGVLATHFGDLAGIFGMGHTKTQAEEMEELAKKTNLAAVEAERLARASNLKGKVDSLRGARTKDQKAEEDAATEALTEAGIGNVARGLRKTAPEMIDSQGDAAVVLDKVDKLKKERDAHRAVANNRAVDATGQASARTRADQIDAEIKRLTTGKDSELERARDATAEQIAASGALPAEWAGNREKIAGLAEKDPKAFGGVVRGKKLAEDLRAADPRAMRDKEAEATNRKLDAKEAEDAKKKADKRVATLSKPLQERFNLLTASGNAPDEAGVRRQLERAGLKPEDAAGQSAKVLDSLKKGYEAELAERSEKKGLTREGAASDLLKEHEDKRAKKAKQDADHAESVEKEKKRDAVEKADKLTSGSGLDKRAETAMLRSALAEMARGGRDLAGVLDMVAKQMSQELQARGMGKEEADLAAREKAGKVYGKLGDEITQKAMEPKEHAVKHIGTADYARSIESAASDQSRKIAENTEAMKTKLADLLRIAERGPRLK